MSLQRIESERVKAAVGLFAECAQHVPEDRANWKPEGQTKSPKQLLEHVAAANQGFAAIIQGKDLGIKLEKADRSNVSIESDTFGEALQAFKTSGQMLSSAIAGLNDSQLAEKRTMPWGEEWEMPRLIATASGHISYHWGQLAYLQTMWGDSTDYF